MAFETSYKYFHNGTNFRFIQISQGKHIKRIKLNLTDQNLRSPNLIFKKASPALKSVTKMARIKQVSRNSAPKPYSLQRQAVDNQRNRVNANAQLQAEERARAQQGLGYHVNPTGPRGLKCEYCEDGWADCETCGGSGTIEKGCTTCRRTGFVKNMATGVQQFCGVCQGHEKVTVNCPDKLDPSPEDCQEGKKVCKVCKGLGVLGLPDAEDRQRSQAQTGYR